MSYSSRLCERNPRHFERGSSIYLGAKRLSHRRHCTGWKAIHAFVREFPEAFVQGSVGTRLIVESGSQTEAV